jgi:hypothetical protein
MPVEAAVMAVVDRCQLDDSAFSGARPLAFQGGKPPCLEVSQIRTEPMGAGEGKC